NKAYELVKRSLAGGKVGKVLSVHSKCLFDTVQVAGQFLRWHRQKTSSGSLVVYKSAHHFDLVNRCLNARPDSDTRINFHIFFSDNAGKEHGWAKVYARARDRDAAKDNLTEDRLDAEQDISVCEGEYRYHREQN
ncbi:hypothetical protein BDV93DRAFT_404667, partial [Ceratobasidium sp. AG-I]